MLTLQVYNRLCCEPGLSHSLDMIHTTPAIPGKLQEFCNFQPELWKTPRKTVIFPALLEFSWYFVQPE